jgi:hypothetical protein
VTCAVWGDLTLTLTLLDSMSYVPLVAPSTSIDRVKFLTSIADSFVYVVSKVRLCRPSWTDVADYDFRWALLDLPPEQPCRPVCQNS